MIHIGYCSGRGVSAPIPFVGTPISAISMTVTAGEWVTELNTNQSFKLRIISESSI
jgi:hypothetical protein